MGDHAPRAGAVHDRPARWRGAVTRTSSSAARRTRPSRSRPWSSTSHWPGATATEMQKQVADKIEKKLQELPYLDRVESYSRPGVAFIQVMLRDTTPPSQVKYLWYQVRKKVADIRGELPSGIVGPNLQRRVRRRLFRHLHAHRGRVRHGRAQDAGRGYPPAAAARAGRQQGRPDRRAAGEDLYRVQPCAARDARRHAAADFRQRGAAEFRGRRRRGRHQCRPHQYPRDRRLLGRRCHRVRAGRGERADFPAGRHRGRQARL